jgi:hypothetical protein
MNDSEKCHTCCNLAGESSDGVLWFATTETHTDECNGCPNEDMLKQSIEAYLQSEQEGIT